MRIAVTTASGQLGSSIINHLKKLVSTEQVIGIARTPENAEHLGIEIREGDYNDHQQFVKALTGVDRLLLVSGFDLPEKRIQQHRNVIEAAKKCGVEKIVYTSIVGPDNDTAFNPIIQSNRQTEKDVQDSGMTWVVGRNGIYIDEDLVYVDEYRKEGIIRNCAGEGKCAYTSRDELGYAYARVLLDDDKMNHIYTLTGPPITQYELAAYINEAYGTELSYESMSARAYLEERKSQLGDYLGTIIAGIYDGIEKGVFDIESDYEQAADRPHKTVPEMINQFQKKNS